MSTETIVTVCGNIATDPRSRRTDDGVDICSFRVASTPRRYDRGAGQWVDGTTSWFSVTAWRGLAANCGESLRKGERVIVQGKLRQRDWTDGDGKERTSFDIDAAAVGHDLAWGRTAFTRVVRTVEVDPGRAEADALAEEVEQGASEPTADESTVPERAVPEPAAPEPATRSASTPKAGQKAQPVAV